MNRSRKGRDLQEWWRYGPDGGEEARGGCEWRPGEAKGGRRRGEAKGGRREREAKTVGVSVVER